MLVQRHWMGARLSHRTRCNLGFAFYYYYYFSMLGDVATEKWVKGILKFQDPCFDLLLGNWDLNAKRSRWPQCSPVWNVVHSQVARMAPALAEYLEVPPVLFRQVEVVCERFDFDGSGVLDKKQCTMMFRTNFGSHEYCTANDSHFRIAALIFCCWPT